MKTKQSFFELDHVMAPTFFGDHTCTIGRCSYVGEVGPGGSVWEEGEEWEYFVIDDETSKTDWISEKFLSPVPKNEDPLLYDPLASQSNYTPTILRLKSLAQNMKTLEKLCISQEFVYAIVDWFRDGAPLAGEKKGRTNK